MFRIWCSVYGGVTGTREAWMKSEGEVMEFETREAAEAEAAKARAGTAGNSRCSFSYTVEEA